MKTNSIFSKLTLAVLVAGTMAACNNKPAATTATPTAATPVEDKALVVYVNSDTLLMNYEYAKDMRKRMEDKQKTAAGAAQSREQGLQREFIDYQKAAQTMPADQRQKTEQRLMQKKDELAKYEQNASAELQNAGADENKKLYDRIADLTKSFAKEKGYKLVLTYSKSNPTVLFGDASLDVTTEITKRLNDEYAKEKK